MKKYLLLLIMLTFFGVLANAQTIENFESLKMNMMYGGVEDLSSFTVTENPDPSGANTTGIAVKFLRDKDGVPWGGFYATMTSPVDLFVNKYVHVKVWKPRISPVKFKFEAGSGGTLEIESINPQTLVNEWEEMVFDFTTLFGEYTKIAFMPDFIDPVGLTEDITIYFDDLYVNNDPTVGSAPAQVMEDYEHIPLNLMLSGPDDLSTMTLVANPDPTSVNLSDYVIKFLRDKDGVPWGGFWSALPTIIDVTDNKFVHVKVWKPRISPIKFKIESGAAGTLEVESMYPQTKINEWEDMVFDFSSKTGTYPIIAFLPDFADLVGLTEDIIIYFDDIILNNDPNPIPVPAQTFNIDMTGSDMLPGSQVWIAGTMGGIYGIWNEPGTNPNNEMFDPDGDGIYSITMHLPDGLIAFKFFWGTGWGHGDPAPGGDRTIEIECNMNVSFIWGYDGIAGSFVQFNVNMYYQTLLGNFNPDVDYVDIAGSFNDWNGENFILDQTGGGRYTITVDGFNPGEVIEYKYRINGSWVTSEFPNGGPNRTYTVVEGFNNTTVWYNDEIPPSPGNTILADFEDGSWGMLTPNVLGCGTYDLMPLEETFAIVDNPNPTGVNVSSKVCKFRRWGTNYGALTWGGFWAYITPELDVNLNKYVHVKLWKPRITPIRFKLEAGSAGTLEIESMAPQTLINEWEEITFDFSSLWGNYPIAVFLPDYEDPLTIPEYIDLYFDDIIVTDIFTEINPPIQQIYNIYPNPVTDKLFIGNMKDVTKVEIYNVTGQLVKSINYNAVEQAQIHTSDLRSGMYILTIYSGSSSSSTKLMK